MSQDQHFVLVEDINSTQLQIFRLISTTPTDAQKLLPDIFLAKPQCIDDEDELKICTKLQSLQGVIIPKYFGNILWHRSEGILRYGITTEDRQGSSSDLSYPATFAKCK
ncbi:hypothetical protein BJ878DRAFT_539221 [Calycina marina]|uniref:Uncharacterized protein n=1 Tax=Calycina marina TaxID=1763456 RepID=A0A9P7Z8W9_9HELO|nr:hypothetical protein BJ878DRAFT_539221 [Calycina marina]